MFDDVLRLREVPNLAHLLTHYAQWAPPDGQAWQDRLMELAGAQPGDLVKLHGELIAQAWIEQNTGVTVPGKRGVVAGCYRVTAAGLRALKRASSGMDDDGEPSAVLRPAA